MQQDHDDNTALAAGARVRSALSPRGWEPEIAEPFAEQLQHVQSRLAEPVLASEHDRAPPAQPVIGPDAAVSRTATSQTFPHLPPPAACGEDGRSGVSPRSHDGLLRLLDRIGGRDALGETPADQLGAAPDSGSQAGWCPEEQAMQDTVSAVLQGRLASREAAAVQTRIGAGGPGFSTAVDLPGAPRGGGPASPASLATSDSSDISISSPVPGAGLERVGTEAAAAVNVGAFASPTLLLMSRMTGAPWDENSDTQDSCDVAVSSRQVSETAMHVDPALLLSDYPAALGLQSPATGHAGRRRLDGFGPRRGSARVQSLEPPGVARTTTEHLLDAQRSSDGSVERERSYWASVKHVFRTSVLRQADPSGPPKPAGLVSQHRLGDPRTSEGVLRSALSRHQLTRPASPRSGDMVRCGACTPVREGVLQCNSMRALLMLLHDRCTRALVLCQTLPGAHHV